MTNVIEALVGIYHELRLMNKLKLAKMHLKYGHESIEFVLEHVERDHGM